MGDDCGFICVLLDAVRTQPGDPGQARAVPLC